MKNTRFIDYLADTFSWWEEEKQQYLKHAKKPLKKSIRVNTTLISVEDFLQHTAKKWWKLESTGVSDNTFYIDREGDLDIALGSTIEHLMGWFYIQEVAASSAVQRLSEKIHNDNHYVMLDMCASPGGKTTQMSAVFDRSTIVANECNKQRLPQLFTNLERMHSMNVCVCNYDGRFFAKTPEVFDAIVLDAPCSGEGTAFKSPTVLENWHIKNIRRITKLQKMLLLSGVRALKVLGNIVYSTCTLNTLENESVIEHAQKKTEIDATWDTKRSWPHVDKTGGFFVSSFVKKQSDNSEPSFVVPKNSIEKASHKVEKMVHDFFETHFGIDTSEYYFYSQGADVYVMNNPLEELLETFFFYSAGLHIGRIENGFFEPTYHGTCIWKPKQNVVTLYEQDTEDYIRWEDIFVDGLDDGYISLESGNHVPLGIARVKDGTIINNIPKKFWRK